mmetsp:Transcript_27189/g.63286  ORF Transcript_27189/g.63286 Transcript_27189/m.63286 type:complete len:206 (+) Transcript_27189:1686-2303(+)
MEAMDQLYQRQAPRAYRAKNRGPTTSRLGESAAGASCRHRPDVVHCSKKSIAAVPYFVRVSNGQAFGSCWVGCCCRVAAFHTHCICFFAFRRGWNLHMQPPRISTEKVATCSNDTDIVAENWFDIRLGWRRGSRRVLWLYEQHWKMTGFWSGFLSLHRIVFVDAVRSPGLSKVLHKPIFTRRALPQPRDFSHECCVLLLQLMQRC